MSLLTRIQLNGVWLPAELDSNTLGVIAASLSGEPAASKSPYMTLAHGGEYLRWPKKRLYKLTAAGAIPHRKHEHRILFHRGELDTWLDKFRHGPAVDHEAHAAYTPSVQANGPAPRERPGPGTEGGTFDAFPA